MLMMTANMERVMALLAFSSRFGFSGAGAGAGAAAAGAPGTAPGATTAAGAPAGAAAAGAVAAGAAAGAAGAFLGSSAKAAEAKVSVRDAATSICLNVMSLILLS